MRARPNPVPDVYARLRTAADEGVRDVALRGDGSAKVFRPLDTKKLGTPAQELDLVRMCVGEFRRTDDEFRCVDIGMVPYLAFAYASERYALAAGDEKVAKVWRFIRSVPKNAQDARRGYLQRGGVSRVLLSARTIGNDDVHCVKSMLSISEPTDTLAFSRSLLWPTEATDEEDGWKSIDRAAAKMRRVNCAWRGPNENFRFALLGQGYLSAGVSWGGSFFVDSPLRGANLSGADMRKMDSSGGTISRCDLSRCDMREVSIRQCDMRSSNFNGARIDNSTLANSDLRNASFRYTSMRNGNLFGAKMKGADFTGADLEGTFLQKSDLVSEITRHGWFREATGKLIRY